MIVVASDPFYLHIPPAPTGTPAPEAVYTYDPMGRVTDYVEKTTAGALAYERTATYNNKSEVTSDVVTSYRSDGTFVSHTVYDYYDDTDSDGIYGDHTDAYEGGAVTHTTTTTTKNGSGQPTTDTINTFVWWDSALQDETDYTPDITNPTTIWKSNYHYDTIGHIASVHIADGRTRDVTFVTDNDNEILRRDEADGRSSGDPHEIHWYFNGIPVGDVTNNGPSGVNYAQSIAQHITPPLGSGGAFANGNLSGSQYANFDQSYDPINGLDYDSTASSYTVATGDTLESIAQQLWGDASYWYMIADANGLSGDADLATGMDLIIPNKIHNDANNATTYSVYDPNQAMGNNNPTAPKPPKHHGGCGVMGQIIEAVVAVAVTFFLPVMAPALFGGGGFLAAAAAAAVGSVVSQGVGLALGIQSKFNWSQVAESAISAGVGNGIGQIAGLAGTDILPSVVRGVIGNVVTQGIEVATGLEKKFDWAGVAAAGISAGVISGISQAIAGPPEHVEIPDGFGSFDIDPPITTANLMFSGMAGVLAGAATRTLVNGSDFGDNIIRALPDAIGQLVGDGLQAGYQSANDTDADSIGKGGDPEQQVTMPDGSVIGYTPPGDLPQPMTEAVDPLQFTMPDGSVVEYTPPDTLPNPLIEAVDPGDDPIVPGQNKPDAEVHPFTDPTIDPNLIEQASDKDGLLERLRLALMPYPSGRNVVILPDGKILSREIMDQDLSNYQSAMPNFVTQALKILSRSNDADDPPDVAEAINDLYNTATGEFFLGFPKGTPLRDEFDTYVRTGYQNIRPAPWDNSDALRVKMMDQVFPLTNKYNEPIR